ncbi:hypothetical protein J2R76_003687 [Bradyrhizobium sp. USDA 4532]|nr:hypothetical protein [Bradyrhizobium sp. USDA 4545]MCP1920096.1 hypothetical protein [Bradyrhizobium sp. USDA 4532]
MRGDLQLHGGSFQGIASFYLKRLLNGTKGSDAD